MMDAMTHEDFETESEREEREAVEAGADFEILDNRSWQEICDDIAEDHAEAARTLDAERELRTTGWRF